MMNPCYRCDNRSAECHSNCEKYKKWNRLHLERKEREDKVRHNLGNAFYASQLSYERATRKKGGKR